MIVALDGSGRGGRGWFTPVPVRRCRFARFLQSTSSHTVGRSDGSRSEPSDLGQASTGTQLCLGLIMPLSE
jgi:hypothetical protein